MLLDPAAGFFNHHSFSGVWEAPCPPVIVSDWARVSETPA